MTLNNKVKENIILTTVQNVWTKGYSLTSVQDIIKKAKAPKGSVYYYFPKGKDEIYLEALEKINCNVKKEFKSISPKLGTLEEYLLAVFDLFISKGKACKRSGFSLTLLAMETSELSPLIAEKCSDILENWRLLLADGLYDRNLPEDLCNPISEWLFTSIQGAISANRIHKDEAFLYNIKSTGRFVIGGPVGDAGLTGRKIIVDTYGGFSRHGGGAFSGKDATKVDRSGAYMARYIAKNIVASGICDKVEVQLAYAIGVAHPVSIFVETFGTSKVDEGEIVKTIKEEFRLTPNGIIETLDLRRPIYKKTAAYGHFGREDEDFTWEKTDKVESFRKLLK